MGLGPVPQSWEVPTTAHRVIVAGVTRCGWRGCWPPAGCGSPGVPTVAEEAFGDVVRAREDVRGDLMRARHRLSKLLLRREIVETLDGFADAPTPGRSPTGPTQSAP